MYRITIYDKDGQKNIILETKDEDEMRETVDTCINDLENTEIRGLLVSRLSEGRYQKPFWEKK